MKPTDVNVMANKDNQSKQYRIYIKESKSWLDDMPDESAAIAEVLEDAELLHALICQLIMQGKSERDCVKEMSLSRNTFVYRRDNLFQKLRSELKDYI